MNQDKEKRLINFCVIGKPNAGKSSLTNRLLGEKLSIVTPKVQTTRTAITGIVTIGNCQAVIIDTPGLFEPSRTLERNMVKKAWSSLSGADEVVFIADSTKKFDDSIFKIFKSLKAKNIKPIILLNKKDLKNNIADSLEMESKEFFGEIDIFKISALSGEGVEPFVKEIISRAKESPWLYEEDDITTLPSKFIASEITREKLFLALDEELPYGLTVETESWTEGKDGSLKINQSIIVAKKSHKNIIVGAGGSMVKNVGSSARKEMEKFFGKKIHLFLFVKIRPDWEENPAYYSV